MSPAPRPGPRYPYRSVGELEDQIARQDRVVAELAEMRRAATDRKTKSYLHEQERGARAVLDWLRQLRAEMREGPPPRPRLAAPAQGRDARGAPALTITSSRKRAAPTYAGARHPAPSPELQRRPPGV